MRITNRVTPVFNTSLTLQGIFAARSHERAASIVLFTLPDAPECQPEPLAVPHLLVFCRPASFASDGAMPFKFAGASLLMCELSAF